MENVTKQLIEKCRKGSRKAQLLLYQQYAKPLYFTCLRIIGNSGEAEEAMQDTFLKIFTHLEQYHYELCFEAWIQRIAVHTAIDYVRRQQIDREELTENYPEPIDTDENTAAQEEAELSVAAVKEALTQLPAGYRVVLSLYLFEGYDMEEISSILHIRSASVRSQYLRGKKKLLDLIGRK